MLPPHIEGNSWDAKMKIKARYVCGSFIFVFLLLTPLVGFAQGSDRATGWRATRGDSAGDAPKGFWEATVLNADNLLRHCRQLIDSLDQEASHHSDDEVRRMIRCLNYVAGASDAMGIAPPIKIDGATVCVPPHVPFRDWIRASEIAYSKFSFLIDEKTSGAFLMRLAANEMFKVPGGILEEEARECLRRKENLGL